MIGWFHIFRQRVLQMAQAIADGFTHHSALSRRAGTRQANDFWKSIVLWYDLGKDAEQCIWVSVTLSSVLDLGWGTTEKIMALWFLDSDQTLGLKEADIATSIVVVGRMRFSYKITSIHRENLFDSLGEAKDGLEWLGKWGMGVSCKKKWVMWMLELAWLVESGLLSPLRCMEGDKESRKFRSENSVTLIIKHSQLLLLFWGQAL